MKTTKRVKNGLQKLFLMLLMMGGIMLLPTIDVVGQTSKGMSDNEKEKTMVKQLLEKRLSQYNLEPTWVTEPERVEELLRDVLNMAPTHFNSQTVRMVLLKDEAHDEFWQLVEEIMIEQMGAEGYANGPKARFENSLKSGVGTVLFFDDESATESLVERMPALEESHKRWAMEVQGSHQLMVWLGLSELGFGANLQHYAMEDERLIEHLGVPKEWKLIGEMPFGKIVKPASPKKKLPVEQLLIIR